MLTEGEGSVTRITYEITLIDKLLSVLFIKRIELEDLLCFHDGEGRTGHRFISAYIKFSLYRPPIIFKAYSIHSKI